MGECHGLDNADHGRPLPPGPPSDFARKVRRLLLLLAALICLGTVGLGVVVAVWPTGARLPEDAAPGGRTAQRPEQGSDPRRVAHGSREVAPPVEPKPSPTEPEAAPPEPEAKPPESAADASPAVEPQATLEALKEEEMQVADRLMKDYPSSSDPLGVLGMVHNRHGNTEGALKCWKRCLELDPRRADAYQGMAMIALRKGRYEEAAALCRKALQFEPAMLGASQCLAEALMGLGRTREAVGLLEEKAKLFPNSSKCYFLLGQAFLQLEEYEKARQAHEKTVKIKPEHTYAYYGLATACARLGQHEKAKEYTERFREFKARDREANKDARNPQLDLLQVRQSVARTCTDAGRIHHGHGFLWKAEKLWGRAAELDPRNTPCRMELATLYQQSNRDREALRVCQQLTTIEADNAMYWMNAGILSARLRQFDAAEQALRRVIELAPERPDGFRALARVYLLAKRNLPEAKTLAATAVRLDPTARHYGLLSEACEVNGQRAEALAAIERAVELDPGNASYRRIHQRIQEGQ